MDRETMMTSPMESLPPTARSCRGRLEPERFSTQNFDVTQDVGVPPAPVMVDSYITKFNSCLPLNTDSTCLNSTSNHVPAFSEREVAERHHAKNAGDHNGDHRSSSKQKTKTSSRHGLNIMTWDEFVDNPHLLNSMFSVDKNEFITHDQTKMNVFFQDCRMLQPTLGTQSSNGLSWTIYIESYAELKSVRAWLTERVSVLVVTLINRNKKRQAELGERASCLVALNPQHSGVKEKLYLALSQAMNSFLRQRLFSVVIDLNRCVEAWSQDILRMRCNAEGAKLIITNGDEYQDCSDIDVNACLGYFCLPIKLIQGATYRVQRRVNYDDYYVDFDDERLFLCTANTKLQIYAETTYGTARTTKRKKNVLKSTMSTQTINGVLGKSHRGDGDKKDCEKNGMINNAYDCDIEDLERGDEMENLASSRTIRSNVDNIYGMRYDKATDSETTLTQRPPVPKPRSKNSASERQRTPRSESTEQKGDVCTKTAKNNDLGLRINTEADVHVYSKEQEKCDALATKVEINSVKNESVAAEDDERKLSSRQERLAIFSRSSSLTTNDSDVDLVKNNPKDSLPNGNISIGVFDDVPSNVTQSQSVTGEMIVQTAELADDHSTKQQKRISKMLNDIMGPGIGVSSKVNHSLETNSKPVRNRRSQVGLAGSNHCENPSTFPLGNSLQLRGLGQDEVLVNRFSRNSMRRSIVARKVADFISDTSCHQPCESVAEQTPLRSVKIKQIRERFIDNDDNKLFTPRFMLDDDRNCFSDHDPGADTSDVDPDSVMSDTEVITSPRFITVKNTDRTISVDSVNRTADTDLELTDCDSEDLENGKKAKLRPKPPPKRGTRGQFDSRRRYLALNSLRRKTKIKSQQAI